MTLAFLIGWVRVFGLHLGGRALIPRTNMRYLKP